MPNLADVTAVVISDLNSIPEIASSFEEIFCPPRREFKYPSLMIDLVRMERSEYYGFYDLSFLFTIFVKDKRSDGLRLLDVLIKNFNRYGNKNELYNISYVAEFNGGYNDFFDLDSGIIGITTLWRIRAIFLWYLELKVRDKDKNF